MCAFTACVRFLRRRGPAGLRSLFFGYSVVIFALLFLYLRESLYGAADIRVETNRLAYTENRICTTSNPKWKW